MWRLSYTPGSVKLYESPGKAGGLLHFYYMTVFNDSHTTIGKSLKHIPYPTPTTHKPDPYYFDTVCGKLPINYPILINFNKIQPKFGIDYIILTRTVPQNHPSILSIKNSFSKLSTSTKHKESEQFNTYEAKLSPGKACLVKVSHNHYIGEIFNNRTKRYTKFVSFRIVVHRPSSKDLEPLLRIVGTSFKLSKVEFTMDLFGLSSVMMYTFFKETSFFNYVVKELNLDHSDIFYLGNPRTRSLALRAYIKEFSRKEMNRLCLDETQKRFFRMEVVAPRGFLVANQCPNLVDLLHITPTQVFSRVIPKVLNYPLIYKRCRKLFPDNPKLALSILCMAIIVAKLFGVKAADKYLRKYFKSTVLKEHPQQKQFKKILESEKTFLRKDP